MTARLPQRSGRHLIYSIWQRSDSPEAFYTCSDVTFGGVTPTTAPTTTSPSPTASPSPTTPPPTSTVPPSSTPPPPTTAPPSSTPTAGAPAWQPDTAYALGALVSYAGRTWQCRQAHTSLVGWEPPTVPALWLAT